MKKTLLMAGAVCVLVGLSTGAYALPAGPGGTIWISDHNQSSSADNAMDLGYVEIDENWDPINTPGCTYVTASIMRSSPELITTTTPRAAG